MYRNEHSTLFRSFRKLTTSHLLERPADMNKRWMIPAYSALHLIPALVLRRQSLKKDPLRMLLRVILGITRSCSFLGGFVFIYHALFCLRSQTLLRGWSPDWVAKGLRRKETFWGIGFATCASLFLEDKVWRL